jgi:hypothetical protein
MNVALLLSLLAPCPDPDDAVPGSSAAGAHVAHVAPRPRDAGTSGPPPEFWATRSHLPPEVIPAWVANLGSDDWQLREEAQKGLAAAGYDGYVACRRVGLASASPEVRLRAAAVCSGYLRPRYEGSRYGSGYESFPRIYNMACRYEPRPRVPVQYSPYNGGSYTGGPEPCDQYAVATFCHWYYLRTIYREWELTRAGDVAGTRPLFRNHVRHEHEATRVLVHDLLNGGASHEWVTWLLTDMSRRQNYWPPASKQPPGWMKALVGFAH